MARQTITRRPLVRWLGYDDAPRAAFNQDMASVYRLKKLALAKHRYARKVQVSILMRVFPVKR